MKAVQLLINSLLPEDLRNYDEVYDTKSLNKIMTAVASKYPDKFEDILHKVSSVGRKASYYQGETITLKDLENVVDKNTMFAQMDAEIAALPKDKNFIKNKRDIFQKYNTLLEKETNKAALLNRNNLAMAILSGARGKSAQLKAMVSSPVSYSDYKGEPVDIFIRNSFAEGISPAAFAASTNGARASTVSTKVSTAKGGDLAKQMAQAAVDLVVRKNDCGTKNGIALPIDDPSLKGRVLARGIKGVPAGTVIDRSVLQDLRKKGVENLEVRSAETCGVHNGLCSKCIGKYFNGGKWAPVGTHVGALASTSVSEPVCLVKGTEVRMADGSVKKIEDIEPGEYVLGSDMNGYCKPTKVVNKFHNGPRNCYRSYIKKGYGLTSGYITLDSTAEHKILGTVRSGDIKLHSAELNISAIGTMPESKYTVRMCQSITGSEGGTVQEPMAMLLGMLVGDGSYKGTASGSAKNAVKLSCYDDEQTEALRKELEPLGLLVKEYTVPHEYRIIEADQYNTANWTSIPGITHSDRTKIRNRVRAKLMEEGMWGQDCYTKTLPKSIWSWDNDSVCKFIGGLIATDGYVTKTGVIGYSSNNIELLKQIKELLQFRLGVYSTNIVGSSKKKPDGTCYNPTYSFAISEANNVLHFAEMIKIPGRKAAILAAANRTSNYKRRGLYKLEKQEWLGVQDTWDLEVDNDTHLFALANGLIVSNTQMALCLNELQLVNMADGSVKLIKDIQIDDMVLGADKEGHTFPVKVLNTFDQGIRKTRVYTIKLLDTPEEVEVSCTKDHKFLNEYGDIVPVRELVESPFTALCTDRGLGVIVSISPETDTHCRDIEVDHPDHLFVLAGGIITSNSAKHTAGMTQSKKTYSGLDALIQFTQSPEKFKDQGAVAELDGKVENIEEAPQGGYYVTINGQKHYTPQGHDLEVKVGDKVEAGDQLSEGLVDAEDIVKYKGLGEGRRYYAERLNKMLADSGAPSDKRNTEILARGALRHVRVTDLEGMGDYLPDDIVDYNSLQSTYKPSESAVAMNPKDAVGKYLQTPVMHYTIGTRITPKVAENLQKYDYNEILVDDDEPGFAPEMQRLRAAAHSNPDWFASQGTSYLTKQLNEASVKGDDTNILENADYRPRLAFGVGFGKNISQTGMF